MFRKMIGNWASKKQIEEAEDFLRRIRTADGSDLGITVAFVFHVADLYRRTEGWDLFEPAEVIALDSDAIRKLSSTAQQMQKEGNLAVAGALIVWVHTLRGIGNFEVRPQARDIWKNIARGFNWAEVGAEMIFRMSGAEVSLARLGEIPSGLSAELQD